MKTKPNHSNTATEDISLFCWYDQPERNKPSCFRTGNICRNISQHNRRHLFKQTSTLSPPCWVSSLHVRCVVVPSSRVRTNDYECPSVRKKESRSRLFNMKKSKSMGKCRRAQTHIVVLSNLGGEDIRTRFRRPRVSVDLSALYCPKHP